MLWATIEVYSMKLQMCRPSRRRVIDLHAHPSRPTQRCYAQCNWSHWTCCISCQWTSCAYQWTSCACQWTSCACLWSNSAWWSLHSLCKMVESGSSVKTRLHSNHNCRDQRLCSPRLPKTPAPISSEILSNLFQDKKFDKFFKATWLSKQENRNRTVIEIQRFHFKIVHFNLTFYFIFLIANDF